MLESIRSHSYTLGTRIFLILLGVVFIFFFGVTSFFARTKPVATVGCGSLPLVSFSGCRQILPEDIDRETHSLRNMIANIYGQNAQSVLQTMNLRQTAVEQLIEQALILNEARRLGLSIGDNALARAISSQSAFQTDGRFDVNRYQAILRDNDLLPATYEQQTRDSMLSEELRAMVSNSIQVSEAEARQSFNLFAGRTNLSYIEVPYANFTAGINPTDQEISRFYQDNKEAFREPERVKLVFIRYNPDVMVGAYVPSEAEIQQFYDQNVKTLFDHPAQVRARHILIAVAPDANAAQKSAARAKAEDILKKLKSGASFGALAKQFSDDPGTRDRGGEIGYFGRGELVKPFEDAAFSLKPGEYAIVQSQYGFHIIEVEADRPAHVDTPEEARPTIIADLKRKSGADTAKQYVEQDLTAAITGHKLEELAKARGLSAVETPFVARGEALGGAPDFPRLAEKAFALKDGEVRVFNDAPEPYLVKLTARAPSHIPQLAQIKDLVRRTIIRVTAESRARQTANSMLTAIKAPAEFAAVAAQNHLTVASTGDFLNSSREIPGVGAVPGVVSAALAEPHLPGVIGKVMENHGNCYLFEVMSRSAPSDADWKTQGPAFTKQMLEHRRARAWFNFVNALKTRADIVIHPELIGASSS